MYLLLGVIILAFIIYKLILRPHAFWRTLGVKHEKPKFLVGNMLSNAMQTKSIQDFIQEIYTKSENERYYGLYQFLRPILMIRDPELIKTMGIKDFDSFVDHSVFSNEEIDPLWSKNLFSSKGDKWHDMRPTLSPSFTGSKMKAMYTLVENCAERLAQYYVDMNKDVHTIEMKDMFTRYANDVIATCAFGINVDSLKHQDNEFYMKGLDITDFSGLKAFKFFGYTISTTLMKLLGVKVISTSTGNFFRKLIKDTIQYREEKNIIRPDMINLLLEARKGNVKQDETLADENNLSATEEYSLRKDSKRKLEITDEDITAQATIFFLAGFDTSSTLMTYVAYELAVNKDIQDKLMEEIKETLNNCNGKIKYEGLMKMKYLDMVISETLRKWPPTPITDRVCNKKYNILPESPNENSLQIQKGTTIWFPIYALHRDSKYFPEPEKFDPERFNDENKLKIHPQTFIPFGVGPRNCIGSRFALMETKMVLFHILKNFEIVPVKKSIIPVVQSKKHFTTSAEGGMWLGLKRRY